MLLKKQNLDMLEKKWQAIDDSISYVKFIGLTKEEEDRCVELLYKARSIYAEKIHEILETD